jgi:hypothetical protein
MDVDRRAAARYRLVVSEQRTGTHGYGSRIERKRHRSR